MAMIVRRKKHFPKLQEGWHYGSVKKVEAMENVTTSYGVKDQAVIYFSLGREQIELKKTMTYTLHEKGALSKLIQGITGKVPGEEFDLETLIGKRCQVEIVHEESKTGDIWDRIEKIKPAPALAPAEAEPAEGVYEEPSAEDLAEVEVPF